VLSSQDAKKYIGKLVHILGEVSWLTWRHSEIIGCIIDAEEIDGEIHVWVYWSDGLTTWERITDVHVALLEEPP